MPIYLVSYHPLAEKKKGFNIAINSGLPPYIDNSIRREPDFQSAYPSISALCRTDKFAPKLQHDDIAVYMTVKGDYESVGIRHWRLVAILLVTHRFETHESAAEWYLQRDLPLPSNCMVKDNPPQSHNLVVPRRKEHHYPRRWDAIYRRRARENSVFLACESLYLELNSPPIMLESDLQDIFGRIPGTRNPPKITENQFRKLTSILKIDI